MKKLILLLLFLPCSSYAQFPMVAAWQTSGAVLPPLDSLKGWFVARDIADSLGKSNGDTTYIWPNRAKWLSPYALGDLYQTTSASKPVYKADSGTVVFDGADDVLAAPTTNTYAHPYTVIIVLRYLKPQSNFGQFISGTSLSFQEIRHSGSSGLQLASGGNYLSSSKFMSVDTVYTIRALYNGASSSATMNGTLWSAGNTGAGAFSGLYVGRRFDAAVPSNISVRAIFVYSKGLSASEVTGLNTYIRTLL